MQFVEITITCHNDMLGVNRRRIGFNTACFIVHVFGLTQFVNRCATVVCNLCQALRKLKWVHMARAVINRSTEVAFATHTFFELCLIESLKLIVLIVIA